MDDEEQPSRIRIVSFGLASAKERFEAFAEFPPQRPTLLSSKWTQSGPRSGLSCRPVTWTSGRAASDSYLWKVDGTPLSVNFLARKAHMALSYLIGNSRQLSS